MQKKLTITIDEEIYKGLHRVIGRGKISGFIENLVRPHVHASHLDASYRELAEQEASGSESPETLEWVEVLTGDVGVILE